MGNLRRETRRRTRQGRRSRAPVVPRWAAAPSFLLLAAASPLVAQSPEAEDPPPLPRVESVTPASGSAEVEAGGRSLVFRIQGADLELLDSVAVVRDGRPADGVRADLEPPPADGAPAALRRVLVAAGSAAEAGDYVVEIGVRERPWPLDTAAFRVVRPTAHPIRTSTSVRSAVRR